MSQNKKRKKQFRIEVTVDPDEMSRTIKISSKQKVTRDEFLIQLIDYIERQTDVTEEMLIPYIDDDGQTIH